MAEHRLHARDREDARRKLAEVAGVLSGRLPDKGGAGRGVKLAAGIALLGICQDNFQRCADGGINDLTGEAWPDLSPTTLALRHKDASVAKVAKLAERFKELPAHRQHLVERNYRRLVELYSSSEDSPSAGRKARRHARALLGILERNRLVSPALAKKLKGELSGPQKVDRTHRLASAAATGKILISTARLLASLTPVLGVTGPANTDQVLEAGGNYVAVGTLVRYGVYHQSRRPRKKKRDGSDRLPRRQFLPDGTVPAAWLAAVVGATRAAVNSPAFWDAFLTA